MDDPELAQITALARQFAEAGFERELEELMYLAFRDHEAEWRAEYGPRDERLLWLEEMKLKYGE